VAKEGGPELKPKTLRQAGERVWLETLNLLAEYGTLVVFSAAEILAEALRHNVQDAAGNTAILVAEIVTAGTMIVPKAIRAISDILQLILFAGHDVIYAARHGTRRPSESGAKGRQNRPGATT